MAKRRPQAAARPAPAAKLQAPGRPAPAPLPADRWLAYGTLPLRLFLGGTFIYAGLQKIQDPGFLSPGSSTYIGTQLQSFATHSPIGFLLTTFAIPVAQLTGAGVIAGELTIGSLALLGIATRWAAAAGALLSITLFLTASWTIQPYFLGSDSIYAVAWITLVLVGDQGVFSVAPVIFGPPRRSGARRTVADLDRRRLLVQLGGAAVGAIWVLGLLPRSRTAFQPAAQSSTTPSGSAAPAASPTPVASPTGSKIGTLADLQAQGFLNFNDPTTGDPAVAVSLSGGSVVAFDAVCTHAGCTVSYDPSQKLIACPCHGAVFDPNHQAAVVAGPAPSPLPSIPLQVGADGGVYAA
ncbi:MAG: TQO small subunit DoxD [Candidatus Dormibacterales bacterium]